MKYSLRMFYLLSSLLGASHTMAAVVITAFPAPQVLFSDLFVINKPIDIDRNGTVNFTFGSSAASTGVRTELSNRIIIRLDPPPDIGGPPTPVSDGYLIQSTLTSDQGVVLYWASSNYLSGYVAPDEFSYAIIVIALSTGSSTDFDRRGPLGFEFKAEDGIHYGYFDLEAYRGYSGVILNGWAYESQPGVGILAGQVPEPSSLILVGAAAVFSVSLRRRK